MNEEERDAAGGEEKSLADGSSRRGDCFLMAEIFSAGRWRVEI